MVRDALPTLSGSDPMTALKALRAYVVKLGKELTFMLENISEEDLTPALRERLIKRAESSIGQLKNEIIETAKEIREVSDRIELELVNKYAAKSEIGEYTEQALHEITVDGKGVTQFFEEISTLSGRLGDAEGQISVNESGIADTLNAVQKINAYIRTGKLEDGVYGIEIGNFSGGESAPYKVRLSENRLSFFVNGDEAAYFSDNSMYISRARVPFSLLVGGCTLKNYKGLTFVAEG
jgi:hypothetical protein